MYREARWAQKQKACTVKRQAKAKGTTKKSAARQPREAANPDWKRCPAKGEAKSALKETLCDRLLCSARESSSRAEERNFRAGGQRSGRRRQWQARGTHLHATDNPEWGQKEGNPEAADQVVGVRATWEPPLSDMCADTQGSETLLQQGAPRPPEGRLHTLHTKTHTTTRAAGQPAHPGGGGHANTQATHGEGHHRPAHPPAPSGGVRGMKRQRETPPPPVRPGKRPRLTRLAQRHSRAGTEVI